MKTKIKLTLATILVLATTKALWIPLAWEWFWLNTRILIKAGEICS